MSCKRTICLVFCLGAGFSLGAYEYMISGFPAANPSNATYSASVTVNAKTAGNAKLANSLETRYRTSTESAANGTVLCRMKPGLILFIR